MASSFPEIYSEGRGSVAPEAHQAPVATHEVTLLPGVPVSPGKLKLAEIVGPMRWNALAVLTKSDMTPEETAAFVGTLRATPALDERPISKWSKDDWRISRYHTDRAFAIAETGYGRGYIRDAQVGFAQSLGRFIDGFPEEEGEMKGLFEAMLEIGTSVDWKKNPNLARELANAYWDVGERVLESWTAQPVRQN